MNNERERALFGRLCGFILAVAVSLNTPALPQENPEEAPIKIQIHGAIEEPIPTLITIHGVLEEKPHMVMNWTGIARDVSQTGLNLFQVYWILRNQRISK